MKKKSYLIVVAIVLLVIGVTFLVLSLLDRSERTTFLIIALFNIALANCLTSYSLFSDRKNKR